MEELSADEVRRSAGARGPAVLLSRPLASALRLERSFVLSAGSSCASRV